MNKFSLEPDPTVRQVFSADTVINPSVGVHKGMKYASWSPLGCDDFGRCLLACSTLDNRSTVHSSRDHLHWKMSVDLSKNYSERLKVRGYAKKDNKPPEANSLVLDESSRRFQMQTPSRMEWSSVYTIKVVQPDNSCVDEEMVLLAVSMENGDSVSWKFASPFKDGDDAVFYDLIESGMSRPSDLAWWEYENGSQRMGGSIVGSEVGPIKIFPVSSAKVKGYCTLRHPIVSWKECDEIPVENIRCFPVMHPIHKTSCSLIVASRGCYVFWCLSMISAAGSNVHNSHITGLYSLPVVSLAVSRQDVAVYTCSMDGWIKQSKPTFTGSSLFFNIKDLFQPESLKGRWTQGIAVSPNGAYIAVVGTQGMVGGFHPINKTYQVHFSNSKTPESAASLSLESPEQNLYKAADLLDSVRWQVLKTKCVPASLQEESDRRIQEADLLYLWRIRLFSARVLHQLSQENPFESKWKLSRTETKVFVQDEKEGGEEEGVGRDKDAEETAEPQQEDRKAKVQAQINAAEMHSMREHVKKVLGLVYLNTWVPQNICIPTCGSMDYLSRDPNDRDSEVSIGHIRKKSNKQTFPERCSLCQAPSPFSDCKQAVCENGHAWLRCVLSYQACQASTFRRCLSQDSVARSPEPEDPEWIKKLSKAPCLLCDSPMI